MSDLFPISDCSIIVMAGGKSRRMGDEKALLKLNGLSFVEKAIQKAQNISSHVFLSVGVHNVARLSHTLAKIVTDIQGDFGPLGGVVSVIPHIQTEWFQLISVDSPHFSDRDFEILYAKKNGFDGVVFETNGQIHPLLGLYHIKTKDVWNQAFATGHYKMSDVLDQLNICYLALEENQSQGLKNINTPEDYHQLISDTNENYD
jgi:molybdopterin-guanine dinucleotide biosynthesis protein A